MKILVCGGRLFSDEAQLDRVLSEIDNRVRISEIIHGNARGADQLAGAWGAEHKIPVTAVPANWAEYGKRAGPIRNMEMLQLKPDLVVAFPGGSGTAHMVAIATKAGLTVIQG